MTARRVLGLRVVLGVLLVYHLGIGMVSVLSADQTARFAAWFYGTDITVTAQFVYALKALGMYALFTASVIGVAFSDPVRFRALVFCVVLLQSLRAMSRLVFFDTLHQGLGVTWERNLVNVALLAVEIVLLLWFARRAPQPSGL